MTDQKATAEANADGGVAMAAETEESEYVGTDRGLLGQTFVVARQEYQLSIRNQWALALTGLFGLFGVLLTAFGGSKVGPTGFEALVVSLASLATYLLPLAALVFGFDTIVGAQEDGWLDVVFALPTPRWVVVVGKYLGRAVTLGGATVIGFGVAGGVAVWQTGLADVGVYTTFLAGAIGVGLSFLSVSVLISTLVSEKTHALGLSLLTWVWFVLVYDLLSLGVVSTFDLPTEALSALVMANPADIFRVLVLSGVETTGGGFAAIYADTGLSIPLLVAGLVAWTVIPLLLASRLVVRRSV